MLFQSMAKLKTPDFFDPGLFVAFFAPALAVFFLLAAIARWGFGERQPGTATFAIAGTYGNILMLGTALMATAFGERGVILVTLIVAVHSPILVTLTALMAESRGGTLAAALRSALLGIVANPILIAMALGFLWSRTGLALDVTLDRFLGLVAQSMTPVALFAMGASLNQFKLEGDLAQVGVLVIAKAVVMPLAIYALAAHVLLLDPLSVAVATLCGAMPSGVTASVLSLRYNAGVARTAGAVLVTTAIACVVTALLLAWFLPTVR
jgi:hypothetical protein